MENRVGKPRKFHKKSRNGCAECKRRHVKCDECKPLCGGCRITQRPCSFASGPGRSTPYTSPSVTSPELPRPDETPSTSTSPTYDAAVATNYSNELFTLEHLAVFHHVEQNMTEWLRITKKMKPFATACINSSLTCAYVMNQLLSVGALHLSTTTSGARSESYRALAAQLQTRGLVLFNNQTNPSEAGGDVVSRYIFPALLDVAVLITTLRGPRDEPGVFLDSLVEYFRLHRGSRVLGDVLWDALQESELLREFLDTTNEDDVDEEGQPSEWRAIAALVESSEGLSERDIATCKETMGTLEYIRCWIKNPQSWGLHALAGWTGMMPLEFVHLLQRRTPEALIILAYYGVMVHQHRDWWVFGDAGVHIVRSISSVLGTSWKKWLVQPLELVSLS